MAETTGERCRAVAGWRIAAAAGLAIAFAAPTTARAVDGIVEVRLGLMHFDYEERDPAGVVLDRETGWVPSLTPELEVRGERVFGRFLGRLAKGTVNYDGHVQSNDATLDGLPVQADSDALFLQFEAQVGGWLDNAKRLALFGGLGARYWSRDIQGTTILSTTGLPTPIGGLSETYRWYELQAGLRWAFFQQLETSWDADLRLVRTFGANISIDLTPFIGTPTTANLDLGSRTGWRVGSTFRHQLNPNGLLLTASAWLDGYAFGRSDVDPAFGIYEPDSKTTNFGLEVGLGRRF